MKGRSIHPWDGMGGVRHAGAPPADPQAAAADRNRQARLGARVTLAVADADSFGLFTAQAVQDPYPHYHAMREREPVNGSDRGQACYSTRYHDVFELQHRPDLSVDRVETIYSYLPRTD